MLLTVMPPSRAPGAVPTAPVGRHVATRLLELGHKVRVLAPQSEAEGWPNNVEIVAGLVTDPSATPQPFQDIDAVCVAGLVGMVPPNLRDLANLIVKGGVRRVVILASHGSDFETEYSPET